MKSSYRLIQRQTTVLQIMEVNMVAITLLALSILFSFVISFGLGFVIGSGKVVLPKKLTEEEKKIAEKQKEEYEKAMEKFNEGIKNIVEYGGE